VAGGACLPDLTLSTTGTLSSATVANLLSSPLRSWSVGAQLAQTLFDGGTRSAALKTQEAAYDEKGAASPPARRFSRANGRRRGGFRAAPV